MRLTMLVLLSALLPGIALAQGSTNPSQRCQSTYQSCIRRCFGPDMQNCQAQCETARAYCIQNPTARPLGENPLIRPKPRDQNQNQNQGQPFGSQRR